MISNRDKFQGRLRELYLRANQRSGGSMGVIRHALTNFSIARGAEASASLAYYALFSIFPILLATISIGSFFLSEDVVKARLFEAVSAILPISSAAINNHFDTVVELRGAVTFIALIALVWSSSNVFEKIVINIDRAFPEGKMPNFFQSRFKALVIILILVVLFILSLALNTLVAAIPSFEVMIREKPLVETALWGWSVWILPFFMKVLLFYAIYTWLPRSVRILPKARWIGAAAAAVLWETASRLLTAAISSGLTNYELVYGSLGSIIALLFWLYWTGMILFLGAHLTNAINYHIRHTGEAASPAQPKQREGSLT